MKTTRYEQVANRILTLIQHGVLKVGEKIPSIRKLSQELQVSVNTIKEAYWKLENEGYIEAIPQSGFFVKRQAKLPVQKTDIDPWKWDPQKVSLCRVYGAFQNMGRFSPESSMGIACLHPDLWPAKRIEHFIVDAMREHGYESFNYLMPPGYLQLREQIARFGLSSGLDLSPEEIVITNGCHEAIFIALMVLCRPGDTIVFESPVYFNLLQLLEKLDLKIIEIPGSPEEGIHLETLQFVIENYPVKAMFSISNFNNPLGFLMPSWKKKKVVELLSEKDIPLIEDDIYGDLSFQERPDTCKAYDTRGNVLLCSSFSKTIAPGLRVGWIAPGKYYDEIIRMKTLLNISTTSINQIAVAKFLREGGYERHLRKLRKSLQQQVGSFRKSVLKFFPKGTRVTEPSGGMLLWVELPDHINTLEIYKEALKKNIVIAPGNLFTMKEKYGNCLRLNAGTFNSRVDNAVKFIGELCVTCQNPN